MEGIEGIEKIKQDTGRLVEESRLAGEQAQQADQGDKSDLVYDGKAYINGSDSARVNAVRKSIIEKINSDKYAPSEGIKIGPSDEDSAMIGKSERVKQTIRENLNKENYVPIKEIDIKPSGGEAAEGAKKSEREKTVKAAFIKYSRMIDEDNIRGLLNVKKDDPENGSVYYKQMREAVLYVKELSERLSLNAAEEDGVDEEDILDRTIVDQVQTEELVEAMTRLSETAHVYYDMHRGMRFFKKGENRKEACNKIRKLTELFFDEMGVKLVGEGLIDKSRPISLEGEDGVKAHKRLAELVKYYDKWKKHFAYNEADERANIKAKADLFAVYEHDMDVYRSAYRHNSEEMDADIAHIIKEARYYKIQNSVLEKLEKKGDIKGDAIHEMAKEHTDELDYREKGEEELSTGEIDRDLSPAQLKAIESIDRWFLRNYNNGGLVGRPLNIKNHHGEIVSELMRRTKRERLFIYYLIETGARKEPKVFDAYASQTEYTPDLDKLKGQMLASRLKVMSRLVGGYVYMHKLTEALQINRDYKALIKDCAKITRIEREKNDAKEINDPVEKRSLMLKNAYNSCRVYKQSVEACNKAKGSKKQALEARAAEAGRKYREDLDALISADNAVGEASEKYGRLGNDGEKSADRVLNRKDNNAEDIRTNMDSYTAGVSKGGEFLGTGINFAASTADILSKKNGGVSWRLAESSLAKVNKYADGYGASTISGLGHAMAMMYGIYNLCENGAKMHAGDIGKEVAGILKSGAETYISYRSGTQLVGQFAGLSKNWDADKAKKVGVSGSLRTAGMITSGVGLMINTYNIASGVWDGVNADRASGYLDNKIKNSKKLKDAPEGETQKARDERLKKLREARYEEDMLKLSGDLTRHKAKFAGLEYMTNCASVLAVTIPGLGSTVFATVGFVGGIAVSILNAVNMGSIREALFDRYFHFDEFMAKVRSKMTEKGRNIYSEKPFRERMRRKLAAAAGYADMIAAADQIAKRYADQICERLFGGKEVMPEEEKKGYIELIKAFGLKYNEKKKIPDAKLLAKKMTGR